MCGRYVSVRSTDDLTTEFEAIDATDGLWAEPDFNVAPTKGVRVVVNRPIRDADGAPAGQPTRQLRVASWGLVPSWAKDRKTQGRMFNARSESLAGTNAFRSAYAKRRCLLPADGWYEWQVTDGPRKQPMYMTPAQGNPLAFAGLYEFWRDPGDVDAPTLTTCTIITAAATAGLADVHDRMPLTLRRADWARWLDPDEKDPADLLLPRDEVADEDLELRPVATLVNKVDNNGAELIERAHPQPAEQKLF